MSVTLPSIGGKSSRKASNGPSGLLGKMDAAAIAQSLESDPSREKTLPAALKGNFTPVKSIGSDIHNNPGEYKRNDVPLVPPREHSSFQNIPALNFDDKQEWFVVLSPRETRGVAGPKSITDLRQMFKYGEITDSTLVWREGQGMWERLHNVNHVRFRIIQTPLVPVKAVANSGLLETLASNISTFQKFKEQPVTRFCCVCGNIAAGHTVGVGEQIPNFSTLIPFGSTTVASEIIPGFLWIGNAASAKQNPVNEVGITLAINCTANLKGALPAPPYFRTRMAALDEKPPNSDLTDQLRNELFAVFDAAYDYIELERLNQSRQSKSDPVKAEYRGPTDKFGRSLQKDHSAVYPASRPDYDTKFPPPRILLWSRLGFDRPCVLAAAYLMKRWGVSHSSAINIVLSSRPGTNISPFYSKALVEWGKLYTLGAMYCLDCVLVCNTEERSQIEVENAKHIKDNSTSKVEHLVVAIGSIQSLHMDIFKNASVFLPVVYNASDSKVADQASLTSTVVANAFQNIYDLCLNGAMIKDEGTIDLFSALLESKLIANIRNINLDDNAITCKGISFAIDCIIPPGANLSAFLDEYLDLSYLTLANNHIGLVGATKIASLLTRVHSLHTLIVSNNNLTDDGVAAILEPLGQAAFYDEPEDDSAQHRATFNSSLTNLNIAGTGMGAAATEMLITIFRSNESLCELNLDMNPDIPKPLFKSLGTILRVSNSFLEVLSFNDGDHSVKSFGYMMKVLEGNAPIKRLSFARSGLTASHASAVAKYLPKAKKLNFLDLSGNSFEDDGAQYIATAIQVTSQKFAMSHEEDDERIHDHSTDFSRELPAGSNGPTMFAPLRKLDLSSCNISMKGCQYVFDACASHPTLTFLDMSDNNIGPNLEEIAPALIKCKLNKLNLNRCNLQTRGAKYIFKLLKDTSSGLLGHTLTSIALSGNNISDSVYKSLIEFLTGNLLIQSVDLGFNSITGLHAEELKSAILIPSGTSIEKQILPLHINLIGNPCPNHMLETPWLSRSKQTMFFGVRKDQDRPRNDDGTLRIIHDEVTINARAHYSERIENFRTYVKNTPMAQINNIA